MIWVHWVKCIHLVAALGLLGTSVYCFMTAAPTRSESHLLRHMLYLGLIALITGSLLVYPSPFTFHTPWIKAAYLLVLACCLLILLLAKISYAFFRRVASMVLMILIIVIMHDAVTKTTGLF